MYQIEKLGVEFIAKILREHNSDMSNEIADDLDNCTRLIMIDNEAEMAIDSVRAKDMAKRKRRKKGN